MSNIYKNIYLNNYHKSNDAKFVPFSGYSMPINYKSGIIKEHLHVRKYAGIFDVSHMGQILIENTNKNINFLNTIIPLNFDRSKNNKSYYSFILNDQGGIIDDLIISKILFNNKEYFFLVYNAGRKKEDEKIFINNLSNYIFLNDNCLISIQGPKSEDVLKFLNIDNQLFFMESKTINYLDSLIIVSRSGYTGEDGFEISIPNIASLKFLNTLMLNSNSKLCGLGCRDSLRLEAGLSLYGNELNEKLSPIEAGLNWAMHKERLSDVNLNGSKTLFSQLKNGSNTKKIGIKTISKSILRANMKLFDSNTNDIGYISSGGFSPTLNTSIGIGYINSSFDQKNKIYSSIRGANEELKIAELPFVAHKYKKG